MLIRNPIFSKLIFLSVAGTFLLASASTGLFADAEPNGETPAVNGYRGPDRDGLSDRTVEPWTGEKPERLWGFKLGVGYSALAELDGRVYSMGNEKNRDIVRCLDAENGEELWKFAYDCRGNYKGYHGPRATPTVDGERVYTVSGEGHLYCLDAEKGEEIWSRKAGDFDCEMPTWGFACQPLLLGDWVVYDLGKIIALDRKTGETVWQTKNFGSAYSSVMPFECGGESYLAAFPAKGLVVVRAEDGEVTDTYEWKTAYGVNAATPIVDGNRIFISSGYNTGCALLEFADGKLEEIYRNKNMSNHFNTCVLYEGKLYGFNGNAGGGGKLTCLDFATGEKLWEKDGYGTGSLMIADGTLVVLGEQGELAVGPASPEGFEPAAEARVLYSRCWTMPMIGDGRLYCRDERGLAVCLPTRPEKAE
jgi:outer membrane protein assembly factor BamB